MQSEYTQLIEFRNVSKYYNDQIAIRELNLTIYQGEFFVLVGGSGSGKSTTLKMINALTEPTEGNVYFHGKRIKDYDIRALRHRIGYVLQQIALFPTMTVAQNIALMPEILGWHKNDRNVRVNTLLELVDLSPMQYQHRYPYELSGGEQQRIGILRAIAANPDLLLMDEPFSALDPLVRTTLQEQIAMIHKKFGTTIVFVTHNMEEALKLACRIGVMHNGKLVQVGTPNDIQQHPANDYVKSLFTPSEQALTAEKMIMQYQQLNKQEQDCVRKWITHNS